MRIEPVRRRFRAGLAIGHVAADSFRRDAQPKNGGGPTPGNQAAGGGQCDDSGMSRFQILAADAVTSSLNQCAHHGVSRKLAKR